MEMCDNRTGCRRGRSTESFLDKEAILAALGISSGQTVLDVGCGDGYMSRAFARAVGDAGRVYALDRPEDLIKRLEEETAGTNISPVQGDITRNTGIEGSSVDLMYLSTVYHIFSDEQREVFRNEAERLLKPGGRLALVEIEKKETPFGPPLDRRVSPEEMEQAIRMRAVSLVKAGEHFYMQIFEKGED
jgi:ubiquinone/menaquinone biosynthesis C-methylase UbiE